MTHDPTPLATVEQIVNGNSPFETVDTPLGAMERWRAEAMLIGTTSGVESVFKAIRADAAERAARADADIKLGPHSFNIYARRSMLFNQNLTTLLLRLPQSAPRVEPTLLVKGSSTKKK